MKRFLFALSLLLPTSLWGADALPADHRPPSGSWEGIVGVPGGIPTNRTQHGSTLTGGSVTAGNIESALASALAAGGNRYVLIGPGTFTVSPFVMNESSVTLRGSVDGDGVPTTILQFAPTSGTPMIRMEKTGAIYVSPGDWTNNNITSGATRGSTTITVANSSGATVGKPMVISDLGNGDEITGSTSTNFHGNRIFTQWVLVTAVNGNQVSFSPAINADYLSGAAQAHWRPNQSQWLEGAGLENLKLVKTDLDWQADYGPHVRMSLASGSWVKNVHTQWVDNGSYMFQLRGLVNCEFRHNDLRYTQLESTSSTYGIAYFHCSGLLVIDNIFHGWSAEMSMVGLSGSALAYNYTSLYKPNATGGGNGTQGQGWMSHGASSHWNLFEGNELVSFIHTNTSGSSDQYGSYALSYFRNRMRGRGYYYLPQNENAIPPEAGSLTQNTNQLNAMRWESSHDFLSAVGNVLGDNSYHSSYSGSSNNGPILNGPTGSGHIRELNYNTVNDAIPAAEQGDTMPSSYLYSSKPSFFGDLPWPWVDPTNFSQSDDPENLPAGYRFFNDGEEPGSGGGDETDPTVSISSPSDPHNTSSATTSISGTASDDTGVSEVDWVLRAGDNNQFGAIADSGTATGTTSWSDTVTNSPGTYTVYVTAHDAAGNTATDTGVINYTPADSTPPTLSSAVIPAAGTTLILTFNENMAESGSNVTMSAAGGAVTATIADVTNAVVTYSLSRTILDDGDDPVTWSVSTGLTDTSGNAYAGISGGAVTNNSTQDPADETGPVISNVQIVLSTDGNGGVADISFETDELSTYVLGFGESSVGSPTNPPSATGYDSQIPFPGPGWSSTPRASPTPHTIHLTFLELDTEYFWRPFAQDASNNVTAGTEASFTIDSETGALVELTPTSHDFGVILVGDTDTVNVSVANVGAGTLDGQATAGPPYTIDSGSPYSVTTTPATVVIQVEPTEAGIVEDLVSFSGDTESGSILFPVSVTGIVTLFTQSAAEDIEMDAFDADATLGSPLELTTDSHVSQSSTVGSVSQGGALYLPFYAETADDYNLGLIVNVTGTSANELWVALDGVPVDPDDLLTFANTSGSFVEQSAGTLALSQGDHYLHIVAKEPIQIRGAILRQDTDAPTAPTGAAANAVSDTQINLSWTVTTPGADNIIIQRSTTMGSGYSEIATLAATATTYNNTGLTAETTYYYVITSRVSGETDADSSEVSDTTAAAPAPGTPQLVRPIGSPQMIPGVL